MNNLRDTFRELRKSFDSASPFMRHGHQIVKMRECRRKIQTWARDDQKIRQFLLRSFPRMVADSKQRARAGRWARVIYLYFKTKHTYSQVAAELGVSNRLVENIIRAIYRASRGLKANGKGLLSSRPTGRPRKAVP